MCVCLFFAGSFTIGLWAWVLHEYGPGGGQALAHIATATAPEDGAPLWALAATKSGVQAGLTVKVGYWRKREGTNQHMPALCAISCLAQRPLHD